MNNTIPKAPLRERSPTKGSHQGFAPRSQSKCTGSKPLREGPESYTGGFLMLLKGEQLGVLPADLDEEPQQRYAG